MNVALFLADLVLAVLSGGWIAPLAGVYLLALGGLIWAWRSWREAH